MKCPTPYCGSTVLKVLITREVEHDAGHIPKKLKAENLVRRRRECGRGHLFWTVEGIESDDEKLLTSAQHFDLGPTIKGGTHS